MKDSLTTQIAKAVLVVCVGGIVIANINFKFAPSQQPYYAVMSSQRTQHIATELQPTPTPSNDTNSRGTSQ